MTTFAFKLKFKCVYNPQSQGANGTIMATLVKIITDSNNKLKMGRGLTHRTHGDDLRDKQNDSSNTT